MNLPNPIYFRKGIIVFYLLVFLASIYFCTTLRVNYLFENFFPKSDSVYINYITFRNSFDVDDRVVSLALAAENGIFNPNFLSKCREVEQAISKIDGVEKTVSLNSLRIPIKTPLGWISNGLISKNPDNLLQDSIQLTENASVSNQFISEDGSHFAIQIYIRDSLSDKQNRKLIESVETSVEDAGLRYKMAGFINTQVNYIKLLEQEVPFTSILATIALSLILMLLYRSPKNALLISGIVLFGLVIFFGYLGLIGRSLNVTSTLFTTIMVFVGVSDVIHLQAYFQKYLVLGRSAKDAAWLALKETGSNLFLTSATTAVGFLTFMTSSIPHFKTFGMDAAVGVLIAFVLVITLVPVLIYYFPPKGSVLIRLQKEKRWDKFLMRLYRKGKNNHFTILASTLVVLILSVILIQKVEVNQKLSGNFSDNIKLAQDFNYFEENFGGVRAFEATIVPDSGKQILDSDVLFALDRFETWLQNQTEISSIISPSIWVKTLHFSTSGGRKESFKLPETEEALEYVLLNDRTKSKASVINQEKNIGRFAARMKDIGRLEAEKLNEQVEEWISSNEIPFQLHLTGSAVLMDTNNRNITTEMFYSLSVALVIISLMMAILFRNIKMVLLSIIPNLVPLIAVGGFMGLTGIPLNAATALIFTIGFVIAIDDTIHFLTRYRKEYQQSQKVDWSLHKTIQYTGRAVVQTSLILFVGYGVMMFSSFKEISYHAILVASTLAFALLSDIFLLPAIIRIAFKNQKNM